MVWSAETSMGMESDKIAAFTIPYTRGRGLDIGCGMRKVWPNAIGYDNGHHFGQHTAADVSGDATDLSVFADASMDFVFSSHNLEHIVDYKGALKEWWRVIKDGGHLVLYLPHKEFYPNIGEPGANTDHKHDFLPSDIIEAMKELSAWEMLENEERSDTNEYSFFQVYKKGGKGHVMNPWQRNPEGKKRCLVIRYGAIGDMVLASSILPLLKREYHVTYNTTPNAQDILLHDPNIDEWLLQDKDQVPNQQLGPYWATIATRYDRVINLCESIEGSLLTLPDRLTYGYSDEARRQVFGSVNYWERTHDIAGVPHEFNPRFYPSEKELYAARKRRKAIKAPVIGWAISGSSLHKIYPFAQVVMKWILDQTPAHIVILSDAGQGKELQDGVLKVLENNGADMSRIHGLAGKLSVREALTYAQQMDVMVGPETGPMNAVCMEEVRKVLYLSHSSHENLTKHWKNTTVIEPKNTPCFPCHRMHYNWSGCHKVEETGAALCASNTEPERLFNAVAEALIQSVTKSRAA